MVTHGEEFVMSHLLRESLRSGLDVLVSVVVALAVWKLTSVVAERLRRKGSSVGGGALRAAGAPLAALIVLVGAFVASSRPGAFGRAATEYANIFQAVGLMIILLGLTNIANTAANWFSQRSGAEVNQSHLSLLRKFVILAIWIIGSVQALSMLGMKVTPALASLGVAGLAIGLALQDTIANLFAGFYLVADRSVSAGDYIKLETGEEGYVEAVGWRNTRIRLWANNVVLIPNAKLTQSVITNMTLPDLALSVYTYCGVSYDSDLDQVESVALETARDALHRFPGGDLGYEPVLRYKEFGDSNINFVVVFRAVEVAAQYFLQHEYIKALHKRFREEGIDISYPIRKIIWNGTSGRNLAEKAKVMAQKDG